MLNKYYLYHNYNFIEYKINPFDNKLSKWNKVEMLVIDYLVYISILFLKMSKIFFFAWFIKHYTEIKV